MTQASAAIARRSCSKARSSSATCSAAGGTAVVSASAWSSARAAALSGARFSEARPTVVRVRPTVRPAGGSTGAAWSPRARRLRARPRPASDRRSARRRCAAARRCLAHATATPPWCLRPELPRLRSSRPARRAASRSPSSRRAAGLGEREASFDRPRRHRRVFHGAWPRGLRNPGATIGRAALSPRYTAQWGERAAHRQGGCPSAVARKAHRRGRTPSGGASRSTARRPGVGRPHDRERQAVRFLTCS